MMKRRAYALLAALMLAVAGIGWRLYKTTTGELGRTAGETQGTVAVTLGTCRGTVYDRHLSPLTNRERVYRLAVSPSADTLKKLSEVLDEAALEPVRTRMEQGRPAVVTLGERLPAAMSGATVLSVPVRYGETVPAQHLIGYLNGDGRGVTGIESAYDALLSAASGTASVSYAVDGAGRVLSGVEPTLTSTLDAATAGVMLTVDLSLQQTVEAVLSGAGEDFRGAAVALDPATGEILAMASFPTYHAEAVEAVLNAENAPLINRALANYNLGSVFKVVTAAAALEAGWSEDATFVCDGSVEAGGTRFHCHDRLGHGQLNLRQAFAASCNCYFIQLAEAIGAEALLKTAAALGFDSSILPAPGLRTASASLPTATELQSAAALANFSFGQGSLLATPLHIAQMMAAAVNGGRYIRPSAVRGTVDRAGNVSLLAPDAPVTAFSEKTASALMSMLREVVNNGTGTSARPKSGGAGGKTGTAETGWVLDDHAVSQSWFAGFYPAYGPRYVIVTLSEDAGETGIKAADLFREICNHIVGNEK